MKMNCKKGDLAVIVRSDAGNEGKIVRCLRYEPWFSQRVGEPPRWIESWLIDKPLFGWAGDVTHHIEDYKLRPLRDSDGEDEVLRLVGKPRNERQEA